MNDRAAAIERKIEAAVREERMLPEGCAVVAGFSGGADSTVLLHFLLGYAREHGLDLTAAHVNHGLRGKESDRDEEFCRRWCRERGVRFRVLRADVRALAKEKSQGLEECGRQVRYSFFRSLCGKNGRIATAHTLTDSAETVLLNLARGAGPQGLSGIPPVRGRVVRPLIRITRGEVEEYCRCRDLSFVTDSTNRSDAYARNRIRHTVLPVLRGINPAFERAVGRTALLLREDEAYFSALARDRLQRAALPDGGYSVRALRALPPAVLSRAVRIAVGRETPAPMDCGRVREVLDLIRSGKGGVTAAGGIQCAVAGNTFFILRENERADPWGVPLRLPETRLPDGRSLIVRPISSKIKNPDKINDLLFNNRINYATILNTNGVVRSRRPGDRFRPRGRGITKTLKKLFNEQKIPPFRRDRIALLECGGRIVWIEGIGASEEAAATEETPEAAEIIMRES